MNAALHESGPGTMRNCAICPLPDLSTIIWVEPSSTDDSRLQGALPNADVSGCSNLCVQRLRLFDQLVGAGKQRGRHGDARIQYDDIDC
jgi:hypothetical protein